MLGKIENRRRKKKKENRRRSGQQMMRWLDGIISSMDEFEQTSSDSKGEGSPVCCTPWGSQRGEHN